MDTMILVEREVLMTCLLAQKSSRKSVYHILILVLVVI